MYFGRTAEGLKTKVKITIPILIFTNSVLEFGPGNSLLKNVGLGIPMFKILIFILSVM